MSAKASIDKLYKKLKSCKDEKLKSLFEFNEVLFFFIYQMRWYYLGILTALYIIYGTHDLIAYIPLKHSTNISNHYTIAWTFIALSVAVVSLSYPLSLTIRDSLTNRVIQLHDFIKNPCNGIQDDYEEKYEDALNKIALFRYVFFDMELPFLISFTAVSVVRVLLCLIGVGFYPIDNFSIQLYEPQLFLLVYLLWAIMVAITWEYIKPFKRIETMELHVRNRDDFESRVKPWITKQFASETASETTTESSTDKQE